MNLRHWYPGRTLDDIERDAILEALTFYQGNKTRTAQSLGIAVKTLHNKLERYRPNAILSPEDGSRLESATENTEEL